MLTFFVSLSSFPNGLGQDVEVVLEVSIALGPGGRHVEGVWWKVWLVQGGLRIPIWEDQTQWV